MLLWQDLPLQWGYSRSVRAQARRQAREAVDLLGPPPVGVRVVRPQRAGLDAGRPERSGPPGSTAAADLEPHAARSADQDGARAQRRHPPGDRPLGRAPPPAPVRRHRQPPLLRLAHRRRPRPRPPSSPAGPGGAASSASSAPRPCPTSDEFVGAERWPDLDWDGLARRHGLQKAAFDRHVPPSRLRQLRRVEGRDPDLPGPPAALPDRDAAAPEVPPHRRVRHVLPGRQLARRSPSSVLDHRRVPKPGYEALRAACQPVIVVADRPPPHVHPGDRVHLDVHVVSDARIAYGDTIVRAHLRWEEEVRQVWSWQGDIPADECVRVGRLDFEVPDTADALVIDLDLAGDGGRRATRRTGPTSFTTSF